MKALFAVLSLALLCAFSRGEELTNTEQQVVDSITETSVTLKTSDHSIGAGVVVTRNGVHYVWTAGHNLDDARHVKTVIDPDTGTPKVVVSYDNVDIIRSIVQDGRVVGTVYYDAQVIRHSPSMSHGGDDIALLRLYAKNVFKGTTKFVRAIPKRGTPVWHIGAPGGLAAADVLTGGNFSDPGRLRAHHVFDLVTVPFDYGSSGGGVFLKKTGDCIGLVLQKNDSTAHSCYIKPAREIRAWAKQQDLLWAVDECLPIPSEAVLAKHAVNAVGVTPPTPHAPPTIIPPAAVQPTQSMPVPNLFQILPKAIFGGK